MNRLNNANKRGVSGVFLIVSVLVLAIALPVSVFLTQKNQESRSKAAGESSSLGICGKSTGEYFSSRPDSGLCDGGLLNWDDQKADDGDWNWTCKGDVSIADSSVECIALKK